MAYLQVQLIGSLNDFLPPGRRGKAIPITFKGRQTLKHLIESIGVPHPEIGWILVNDQPAELDDLAIDGTQVQAHPYPAGDKRSRPDDLRFILDGHLGKLASYMRILGFDTTYGADLDDAKLASISVAENRVLLTRDRGLLKRRNVIYGYFIRSQIPRQQLLEVNQRYSLLAASHPCSRCPNCNGLLNPVEKNDICEVLQEKTKKYYDQFWQCQSCNQIYWRGSHYKKILDFLMELMANS